MSPTKHPSSIAIYTDGACQRNPGPGGYGVVILDGRRRRELSGGFRRTTNNRMELMAAIVGLSALEERSSVTLYTDSQYVANGIKLGWAKRWRAKGWMRNETDPAINPDLWARLLELCDRHDVRIEWVRGHAGNTENERADRLSVAAAERKELPIDTVYEGVETPPSSDTVAEAITASLFDVEVDEIEASDAVEDRDYRALPAWALGVDLAVAVCRLARDIPSEDADLATELRRAACAIPARIAETIVGDDERAMAPTLGALAALDTVVEVVTRLEILSSEEAGHLNEQMKRVRALIDG